MAARTPFLPRLARLAQKRSASAVLETVGRAGRRELACRRIERGLRTAQGQLLVGPFLGEVGFELLYWIPMLRRLLAQQRISPDRVTVLTRGGAGAWYRDVAARRLEILDLLPDDDLRPRLAARRARAGDAKQLTIESLDRELVAAALERVGPATVVHPLLMYTRLRWIWQGVRPVSDVLLHGDYRPLPVPDEPLAGPLAGALPDGYVALKAYFSDCFPATEANRRFLDGLVSSLAEVAPVVALSSGRDLDDHEEWRPRPAADVLDTRPLIDPRDNLAVQTALVARSRALVTTYGGFSYLGPFLAVPTIAFRSNGAFNEAHLGVVRQALPAATFEVADSSGGDAFAAFVRRTPPRAEAPPP